MKNSTTQKLYDYWNDVRAGRPAPKRLEMDPSAIAPILRNVFILERRTPTSYHFRLAGTRLCAYLGGELRGRSFTSLWSKRDHEALTSMLYSITENAWGGTMLFNGYARGDRAAPMEMLMLPLMRQNGTLDRIVGTMTPLSSPYWLGMWPLLRLEIDSSEIIRPDGESTTAQAAMAGHPPDYGDGAQARRATRFRVINGGQLPPGN